MVQCKLSDGTTRKLQKDKKSEFVIVNKKKVRVIVHSGRGCFVRARKKPRKK